MHISPSDKRRFLELIEANELPDFFALLRERNLRSPELIRLEQEYVSGRYGHDLHDRLKVCVNRLNLQSAGQNVKTSSSFKFWITAGVLVVVSTSLFLIWNSSRLSRTTQGDDGGNPDASNMVSVPGGSFVMGSMDYDNEKPPREVRLNAFKISAFETTVDNFNDFVQATGYKTVAETEGWAWLFGNEGWKKQPDLHWKHGAGGELRPQSEYNHPVLYLCWYDVLMYCNWKSQREGLRPYYIIDTSQKDPNNAAVDDTKKWTVRTDRSSDGYRLPTESEWEYAAGGGGKQHKFAWGDNAPSGKQGGNIADWTTAYYKDNYLYTAPVGLYAPNAFGLYDMSGNVWEMCWDWYADNYYGQESDNPQGPSMGFIRIMRGGSWFDQVPGCRTTARMGIVPNACNSFAGFRLARNASR